MVYQYSKSPSTSFNLLLVDEDRFIARILLQTLQSDFNVIYATNVIEAMNWLENGNSPEIIITELNMTQLDGRKFIQLVRNSAFLGHLPIIVLSDNADSNTRIECLENGADGFLVKPFNPLEVKAKARAILRRSQTKSKNEIFPYRMNN